MQYEPGTWEWGAAQIILQNEMDVSSRKINSDYGQLFDSGMYNALACCAWAELKRNGHSWTLEDQVSLMAKKQHDYGHANILKFGVKGVEVRLWDKIARYTNLKRRNAEPNNESLIDTLIDIIGYTVIYGMLMAGSFQNPLEADTGA